MTSGYGGRLAGWLTALWLAVALIGWADSALAQDVTASARVKTSVVIRAAPDGAAPAIGALRPGDRLKLQADRDGWRGVILGDGRTGYVSKSWTTVLEAVAQSTFKIHVVDVGTGLALFVEGPDFTLVYDGGSNDDLARGAGNRLIAYLRKVRPDLTSIDHVILSHPHRDHVELLADLIGAYQIRNVWDSGALNPICGYRAFLGAIAARPGVAYHDAIGGLGQRTVHFSAAPCYGAALPDEDITLTEASRITPAPVALGQGAQMTFLYIDASPHSDFNENSLVTRLDLGPVRILFPGDAEAGARRTPTNAPDSGSIEAALLACCAAQLHADILIAGHHGSMTSSRASFLDAVGAKTFVISSGPTKYGSVTLPDQAVVEEMTARGTVWRTDVDDAACAAKAAKIGPDADGKAGGCDNILLTVTGGTLAVSDQHISD